LNNQETNNTTNILSKNGSCVYGDNSYSFNKTFKNKVITNITENEPKQITNNLTVINQNCKNPKNNKIVILNTPFIEKNMYKKDNNNDENFLNFNTDCLNNFKYNKNEFKMTNKSSDISLNREFNSNPTTLINERYNSESPSLKKIEFKSNYNKISNYKPKAEIEESPFRTINNDSDEISKSFSRIKNNYKLDYEHNSLNKNCYQNSNSFITIHEENYQVEPSNKYKNKIYIASDNPQNLEVISNFNSFNEKQNSHFNSINDLKSKDDCLVFKSQDIESAPFNRLFENKCQHKIHPFNKSFSNNYHTIDKFSNFENAGKINENQINNNGIKFKLVKKNIRDLNLNNNIKRINSKIKRNYSLIPSNESDYSNTINIDKPFRSYSGIRLRNDSSQPLNDLSKILKNKSVEKLTNMNFDNFAINNTKDGIEIIDKLISNLTRLKTIMIEEDKNNKEMYS